MESSLSSSSLPAAATNHHQSALDENQTQTRRRVPHNDDGENDEHFVGNGRQYQANVPLSLSGMRSSSCNDMTSELPQQQRRTTMGQANRGQLLEAQLQQQLRQQQQQLQFQSQSEGQEQPEREVVLPATTTTMSSQKSLFVLRPVHRYVDLVCIGLSVLAYLLETTMNAALAIFGIGVGVGLVLGDSFRAALPLLPSVQVPQHQQHQQGTSMTNTATTMATQAGNELRSVSNLLPAQ
jgi:hypothetical protein